MEVWDKNQRVRKYKRFNWEGLEDRLTLRNDKITKSQSSRGGYDEYKSWGGLLMDLHVAYYIQAYVYNATLENVQHQNELLRNLSHNKGITTRAGD